MDGLSGLGEIFGSASDGGTTVLIGQLVDRGDEAIRSRIWRTTDGRHWDRVLEPPAGQRFFSVTAGGPGFVAVGTDDSKAIVWTSADGAQWREMLDDSFDRGIMRTIVATNSGLVAFGFRWDTDSQVIWTSQDGTKWLAATNESGLRVARGLQAVAALDGRAIALVGPGEEGLGPIEVWETTGRAEWKQTASLPDADHAAIWRAAAGPRGWVAISPRDSAWFSADGVTWERAATGPDVSSVVIGVDAGFVATGSVGSLGDETCGDQRDYHGQTWTSTDGRTWEHMRPTSDFEWASIGALLEVGPDLVGIGGSYPGEHSSTSFVPTRWTAPLPRSGRTGASDRPSKPQPSCG